MSEKEYMDLRKKLYLLGGVIIVIGIAFLAYGIIHNSDFMLPFIGLISLAFGSGTFLAALFSRVIELIFHPDRERRPTSCALDGAKAAKK